MPIRVPPSGSPHSKIAFIGEAPGADEIVALQPFVGAAGGQLDRLLSSVGLSRQSVYIDNVVQEKPSNNDIEQFIDLSKKNPFLAEEFLFYKDELRKRLEKTTSSVFVPLGNVSLFALTGIHPGLITSRRGSVYPCTLVEGRKVIPTIHPAAALRNHVFVSMIKADLQRIIFEANFPEIILPNPKLIVQPTFDEAMEYLDRAALAPILSFDVEGTLYINCISFCFDYDEAISIPFTIGRKSYYSLDEETLLWRKIGTILENKKQLHLGQNVNYDTSLIYRLFHIKVTNLWDTMVAQAILYPDYPKNLGFLTRQYTKFNYYKDEGHAFIKGGSIDEIEKFWRYSAMDALVPFVIQPVMLKLLNQQQNIKTFERQNALLAPVQYMQTRGLHVDDKGMRDRAAELTVEINALTAEFQEIAGAVTYKTRGKNAKLKTCIVSPTSNDDLRAYFYGKLGLRERTKKGKVTLDESVLDKLAAEGIKEAQILHQIRALAQKRNFCRVKLDPLDNRLRCSFNVAGTTSGRWSSSKFLFDLCGRNLHNLPKKADIGDSKPFRKFVLSDEGYIIVRVDLSMVENRVVAYIAPDMNMIRAFELGVDLHRKTAALILNKTIEEVTKDERNNVGKPCNHGGNYGMGYRKLSEKYQIPLRDAKIRLARYLEVYPGVNKYHLWATEEVRKTGYLTNCYGRRRLFLDRAEASEDEGGKTIFYYIPQSTCADKINEDGVLFIHNNPELFQPLELLLQIHDEIDFQFPISTPIKTQFKMLKAIKDSLEIPIWWKSTSFVVPAEFSFGFNLFNLTDYTGEWTLSAYTKFIKTLT